ncbi:hypothetical protein HDU98_003650 [Podochytrium sp. JEL0797]|nr:hypothetical protein HDU98_003650 [Podochytrium sp. JEL0797]
MLNSKIETPTVGTPTTTVHIAFYSKLGWMVWKDGEASLCSLFERAFGCLRVEVKFTQDLDQFGLDLELPNTQVAHLEKQLYKKHLLAEIDKIHGLSPSFRNPDCRVLRTTKSLGSGVCRDHTKSSVESLQSRIDSLQNCSKGRRREVDAIVEQWNAMQDNMNAKAARMEAKIDAKPPKLIEIENWVVGRVMDELKSVQEW